MINLGAPAQAVHKFDVVHYFASCPIKSLYYIPFRIKWYNISFTEFLWDCCVNSSLLLNAFLSAYSPSKNWQVTTLPSYKLPILSSSSLKSQWREIIDIKRSVQSNHIIWCGLWCSNWILFGRVCGSLKKKKKRRICGVFGSLYLFESHKTIPFCLHSASHSILLFFSTTKKSFQHSFPHCCNCSVHHLASFHKTSEWNTKL